MRKLAVAAFLAVTALLFVRLFLAASDDRSAVAFTSDAPPSAEVVSLAPGRTSCDRIRFVDESFDAVGLSVVGREPAHRLRVVVRNAATGARLGGGRAVAGDGPTAVVASLATSVARGPIAVCVTNDGGARLGLLGSGTPERRARPGVVRTGAVGFTFLASQRTLLERLPDAFERAALFKPGWVGAWTYWALAGLVLLGVPGLLSAGLASALDEGRPRTARERYRRFVEDVEPGLTRAPRLHRFAVPPVVGEPDTPAVPLALCIVPRLGHDARATHGSIEEQTRAPAEVLEMPVGEALGRAGGDWLAVVDAGDVLAPRALERLGQAATLAPDAALVTCDEDRLGPGGEREEPSFRPGPSPDLLPAVDLTSSLVALHGERAGEAAAGGAGWRHRTALALAARDSGLLAHVPQVLVHTVGERERGEHPGRARRPVPSASVDVVVVFRDRPELLRRCARSVLGRSTHAQLGVRLVDNGSSDPEMPALLDELAADPRVEVTRDERPFNFAALNNAAAAASSADHLLFLNNDTEVITASWVEDLLEEAARPEVGAVAPLLLYPDGTVQHAGAALGLHGYAGHPFAGLRPDERTPFGAATDGTRNWLAVTAACMLVERRKFQAVGGFDESFVVAGNDVDLCLRLTAAGYRSLCVPHARLLHDESRSRGAHIDPGDFGQSERSYGEFRTVGDPFYNPNLTLALTDCGPRLPEET
jgi:GT2 family glycosyltransferase